MGLTSRTVPPTPSAAAPGAPGVWAPNAPKSTFASERFMALPIRIVSSVPEEPTSDPAMISAVLSSTKPAPAADRPVNAFSIEITTGMSAPPTGMISITPNTSAPTSIAANSPSLSWPVAR